MAQDRDLEVYRDAAFAFGFLSNNPNSPALKCGVSFFGIHCLRSIPANRMPISVDLQPPAAQSWLVGCFNATSSMLWAEEVLTN